MWREKKRWGIMKKCSWDFTQALQKKGAVKGKSFLFSFVWTNLAKNAFPWAKICITDNKIKTNKTRISCSSLFFFTQWSKGKLQKIIHNIYNGLFNNNRCCQCGSETIMSSRWTSKATSWKLCLTHFCVVSCPIKQ